MRLVFLDAFDVARFLPVRKNGRDINKGTFGHVGVIAGSMGFAGAPVLVAEAASRVGAGLVTLVVPKCIHPAVMSRVSPVVMTHGLKSMTVEMALSLTEKATVVALGPGLGESLEVAAFLREFIARCRIPLVVDADALNFLATEPDHGVSIVRSRTAMTVLTPHPGEMGRLLGRNTVEIQEDRKTAVMEAARVYHCVVVLKGAHTLIVSPDGILYFNTTGNPGMATGGTGDALTGVIAGLIAQGLEPITAALAGVYVHGKAGDLAAENQGGFTGMLATDLIAHLPRAIATCQNGRLAAVSSRA